MVSFEGSVLMQNEWWMRPALQKSEAVLLPALERSSITQPRFSRHFTHVKSTSDPFVPVADTWQTAQTQTLSTYVRPRGSMAGRGVLRAAGVNATPYGIHSRPRYSADSRRALLCTARRRFR